MTSTTPAAATNLVELIDYLRASSCTEPNGHQSEHDHFGLCLTTPVAQVSDELLHLLGDVACENDSVETLLERFSRIDFALVDDEDREHLREIREDLV
jgi:hypothetical protein